MSNQSTISSWSDYYAPIVGGMGAILPTFPLFKEKSSKQIQWDNPLQVIKERVQAVSSTPLSKYKVVRLLIKESLCATPSIGFTIGLQVIAQNGIEGLLNQEGEAHSFRNTFISSTLVAVVSAPSLLGFNGLTAGKGFFKSIGEIQLKEMGALVTRETFFLASLGVSKPLAARMKQLFGEENIYIEPLSLFMTGVIGSLCGHPFDTAITRWQNKAKIVTVSELIQSGATKTLAMRLFAMQMMNGGATKALAVGLFFVIYSNIEKHLK